MTPPRPFVIAVDVGGTHTRVGCFDLDGTVLSAVMGRGGSPEHNHDSEQNVKDALAEAITKGALDPVDAVGIGAGVAAIKRPGSNQGSGSNAWAERYLALPTMTCPRLIVNDAVTAHRGALLGEPGIVVVAGTGSMILAITDDGVEIESGQFEHYAGASRHLAMHAMQLVLAGEATPDDAALVSAILDYWNVGDLADLRNAVSRMGLVNRFDVNRRYGALAPLITAAADASPLARRALTRIAEDTALGIAVLAASVGSSPVPVATAGGLATDPRFVHRLGIALAAHQGTPTRLGSSVLDPLGGAALLAYEAAGVTPSASVIDRLAKVRRET